MFFYSVDIVVSECLLCVFFRFEGFFSSLSLTLSLVFPALCFSLRVKLEAQFFGSESLFILCCFPLCVGLVSVWSPMSSFQVSFECSPRGCIAVSFLFLFFCVTLVLEFVMCSCFYFFLYTLSFGRRVPFSSDLVFMNYNTITRVRTKDLTR